MPCVVSDIIWVSLNCSASNNLPFNKDKDTDLIWICCMNCIKSADVSDVPLKQKEEEKYVESSSTALPPPSFGFFKISHLSITANSCFFSPFSLFLSLPPILASSIFFPLRLSPSSETMVKDNLYRKPPIYRQHGTVFFLVNTSFSGLVSARCVACRLSVISSSPSLFFFEETPWIYMHRAGVKKKWLHLCYFMLSNQIKSKVHNLSRLNILTGGNVMMKLTERNQTLYFAIQR